MRKAIVCFLMIVVLFSLVACDALQPLIPEETGEETVTGQLDIFRSDLKLTQDQVMSQIKAEYLLENGGYKDDDRVVVMITLENEALIDTYNKMYANTNSSVGEYAKTPEGLQQAKGIAESQEKLIDNLQSKGLIESVEHVYSTIINAVAVTIRYGDMEKIQNMSSVKDVILSDTYNRPQDTKSDDASVIENDVDVYPTGIFNSGSVDYTGIGTAVAILDSGFDCSHSVFQNMPEGDDLLLTQEKIQQIITQTDKDGVAISNAAKTTPGLKISDVYYSDKIPFVYDYADKDSDVFPYDSEHGTHVAGIIGGKDDVITGVAINTQLVLMKVFPDLDDGADTDDILAALEDAVLLEVDAINMSLGSSCGFAREEDGNKINDVYDAINESGVSLLTAASNSYSSAYGGEQGNTNKVTNPDSGTVGSPSTYAAALSVASISGTKSKYITATDSNGNNPYTFFFLESNAITGDPNDFFKELGITEGQTKTFEYVTVPGDGLRVNYAAIDVKGKIALVRRGDNTFEEKAQIAKSEGAIACIIYNNVEGDIYMSMGKSDHIPTVSISKEDGTTLAQNKSGKMTISYGNQAGPFMSDFSSWGPSPSLELKPDITAHGGNILSAVPGGGYDELSGTSMATPNLCGIVVLIRQYLKDSFPEMSMKEISVLANQLLMSTATIVQNQEGNPYSPRKQGAGLASLANAVNTKAYITVDGKDRSKIELYDDPDRIGEYTMNFNVVNFSDEEVNYDLSLIAMTESVSSSDNTFVAEKSQILGGDYTTTVDGVTTDRVTVQPHSTVKVQLVYTLSKEDMTMLDTLFPYGMYVEGFVKLNTADNGGINLNVPFLAFYGDWTEAPMFDKTYYEVESTAHNEAIDDEDKVKADYYATTPYGSYYYNYIIPLGTYLYDIDTTKYDAIPASEDHIAMSNVLGTIDGISSVYGGLLRNAKTMTFTITDKVTGEVVYSYVDYNANKAYSLGGSPIPYFDFLKISAYQLGFVNNRQYEFKMEGLLDYGDGGADTNVRNSFSFDFYMDDEAPIIRDVSYEKVYDKTLKKDRYYINLTVYDNHYVQSITPLVFTSSSTYAMLTENPIPVYGERGEDVTVRFEITDYLENIGYDALITSGLAFSIDDYALNSNIFVCQLPGTRGDFKFTKDGTLTGSEMVILPVTEGEVVDLTQYLATADATADADKDYLKYLNWTSSDTSVVTVKDGIIHCLKAGRATVTVTEQMDLKKANIIINVKSAPTVALASTSGAITDDVTSATMTDLRFSYFDTLFAYSRAAQTSEIGSTGDRMFLSSMSQISFYPGEKVKLAFDLEPWYAKDNYTFSYSSTNETVATVNQEGEVTALKKGNATITLKATNKYTGKVSNIMATVRLEVKSEFVIEDRMLVAYKGLGGRVVIPDDEGILYIGAYAFCLYETDYSVELPEDDYDANKIPSANTSITEVVIPYGVEEIQKYAFYNCTALRVVEVPTSLKYIREYAFYNDKQLTTVKLLGSADSENLGLEATKAETVGKYAFYGCEKLENINISKIFAIGDRAFAGCAALQSADLSALRNTGAEAFRDCTALASVVLTENTKLSYAMFARSGLQSVEVYEKISVPDFCFAQCENLQSVTINNSLVSIGKGAFSECPSLDSFRFIDGIMVENIGEQAFYGCTALATFTLPDNSVTLGNYCFLDCTSLQTVVFDTNTVLAEVLGSVFQNTALANFDVTASANYTSGNDNGLLLSADGKTVVFAATAKDFTNLVLSYENIGAGAFCGTNVVTLTFTSAVNIGDYAFANCKDLTTINFADAEGTVVGKHSFNYAENLTAITNLDKVKKVGDYAFANTGLRNVVLGADSTFGEGAFFLSDLEEVTIGANSTFGLGAFQDCKYLTTVNMPEGGNVHFGQGCFARDVLLSVIDLSKVDDTIEDETFYGCTSLVTAVLTNVKYIGNYAFADCSGLRHLQIPVAVSIGNGAFGRYSEEGTAPQISEVVLPQTLTHLGDGAFMGCNGLIEVVIPDGITEIPDYLFTYCINLVSVTLPQSVTYVGDYAFAGCERLSEINLENVREIAPYAFYQAASLQNIDLTSAENIGEGAFATTFVSGDIVANNLKTVGDFAFKDAYISSFTAQSLQTIGTGAFQNNLLTAFVFSDSLKSIAPQAFLDNNSLTEFLRYRDGKTVNDGEINDYALLDNGVLYTVMPSGYLQLTSVPAAMDIDTLNVLENTWRIDYYAGNANANIVKVVLPDSLKIIGNYAFYGYKALKTVEFKSFTAPALESSYDSNAVLSPSDPGYNLLHNSFDIGGWELGYYNFINLVGKNYPINMILPANEGIVGYDSVIYLVYFGSVEDAQRSDYVARDKNLVLFFDYAKEIAQLHSITLVNETLINNAVSAYNAITQDPTQYGYSREEWENYVNLVLQAKETLRNLKLANASLSAQQIQREIDALPEVFSVEDVAMLSDLAARIAKLVPAERMILDLTKYTALQNQLTQYNESLTAEMQGVRDVVDSVYIVTAIATALAATAVATVIKRRYL